jgi:hypothetical protein
VKHAGIKKNQFASLSRSLLQLPAAEVGDLAHSIAKRYLGVLRRKRTLERGIKQAHAAARIDSPLGLVLFAPPLSVAGAEPHVIARARDLAAIGLPFAFEHDGRGLPRGSPIDELIHALAIELGRDIGGLEVIDMYRHYMAASPALIGCHPEARYRKIGGYLNRLIIQRAHLEEQLAAALAKPQDVQNDPKFTLLFRADDLRQAVHAAPRGRPLLIGASPKGVAINSRRCTHIWAKGSGAAALDRRQVRLLLRKAEPDEIVGIQCRLADWLGWRGSSRPSDDGTTYCVLAGYYTRRESPY